MSTRRSLNCARDDLAVVRRSWDNRDAPLEAVEFSDTLLAAHANYLVASIQRVLHHVLTETAPTPVSVQETSNGKDGQPNILFIMADDIGWFNLSCYNHGVMGYRTPNIDRIAKEGAMFTDFYGQQSCTAGRAAFITGQSPIRTGLTKVGMPGATLGLSAEDPTHRRNS